MTKAGIHLDLPGGAPIHITTLLTDFTGTLSNGGALSEGVRDALCRLAELLEIHVLTADTFGVARQQLAGVPVEIFFLNSDDHTAQKQHYGERFGLKHCAVLGNGNNDSLLLEATKQAGGIAIAVDNGEGCSTEALLNSSIFIAGARNALNLLLEPKGCLATLRR